jgi:hypothetical protein
MGYWTGETRAPPKIECMAMGISMHIEFEAFDLASPTKTTDKPVMEWCNLGFHNQIIDDERATARLHETIIFFKSKAKDRVGITVIVRPLRQHFSTSFPRVRVSAFNRFVIKSCGGASGY